MIILLHSSKTMKVPPGPAPRLQRPVLLPKARQLHACLAKLTPAQLATAMHISPVLAAKTHAQIANWTTDPARQSCAVDTFVGDIYSGLRARTLSSDDRDYANRTLRILSGLYGILRPYDGICAYRLEMGYTLPVIECANLYTYWGKAIAQALPPEGLVINTSSAEYTKVVLPFIDPSRVVTPQFLTVHPATGTPTFVAVHAKIARGAFARWLITTRITDPQHFDAFADIGYRFQPDLSTIHEPTFVAQTFEGKGLSMRI